MRKLEFGVRLAAVATLAIVSSCGAPSSNSVSGNADRNTATNIAATDEVQNTVATPIESKMPPAPDLSTLEGRTEAAIIDQLSCGKPVKPAKVVNAMLRNKLLKETDDTGEDGFVYAPTKRLSVLGFPLVRVTGWQMMENSGEGVPPFIRTAGVPPPDFLQVTVRASPQQVRSAIKALGIREEGFRRDPAQTSVEIDGKFYQPQRRIPGMRIEEGDMWEVENKMKGVTTLSCNTEYLTFKP